MRGKRTGPPRPRHSPRAAPCNGSAALLEPRRFSSVVISDRSQPASYAAIAGANDTTVDFHQPLSKAYLGLFELGCDAAGAGAGARACSVLVMYDKLGNGNLPPPGPAGQYDQVFTMEAVITAPFG